MLITSGTWLFVSTSLPVLRRRFGGRRGGGDERGGPGLHPLSRVIDFKFDFEYGIHSRGCHCERIIRVHLTLSSPLYLICVHYVSKSPTRAVGVPAVEISTTRTVREESVSAKKGSIEIDHLQPVARARW